LSAVWRAAATALLSIFWTPVFRIWTFLVGWNFPVQPGDHKPQSNKHLLFHKRGCWSGKTVALPPRHISSSGIWHFRWSWLEAQESPRSSVPAWPKHWDWEWRSLARMRKKRPKSRAKSGAQSAAREISAQQPVAQSPVSKEHGFIGVPKPRRCCASRSGSRAVKFTKSMGPFVR